MRVTPQRERVLRAVECLGHATPDEVHAAVRADGGPELPASTVYRALEALEEAGVLRHTHLHPRSPSFQVAEHDPHIHLVCNGCGTVLEVPRDRGEQFTATVLAETGFEPVLSHAAINGRCATCRS